MRSLLLSSILVVVALGLPGCYTIGHEKIAPAVYEETHTGAIYWTLVLDADGRYFLTRLSPDQKSEKKEEEGLVRFDSERGGWRVEEKKLILKSDAGVLRTFAVHHGVGGQYLEDESHTYPTLHWESKELNYD